MATLEEYLAMLQPDPAATRKAAMMEAIGALGAGLLSGRNWQQGISRGGLLAYDAMQGARDRASGDKLAQLKLHMSAQEMADKDAARESDAAFAKQIGGVFAPGPRLDAMQPGGPTPANATRVAPPGRVEKLRQAAELYAARGQVKEAQMLLAEAEKMEGTFSVDPKTGLGADGKPQFAQFSNKGGYRVAEGFAPPPDLQAVNLGDKTAFIDKLTTAPGASFAHSMSPDAKASNALGWANNAVSQLNAELQGKRLDQELNTSNRALGLQTVDAVTKLRKEYNDLPAVKNYQAALPIFESVQNSPDTKAGDLDLIYAVGKVLDPNSVVREGEMVLVTKSGSPAQRITGFMNMLRGRGQLPPEQRKELREMLANRMESLRWSAEQAGTPYVKQAKEAQLPMDQIFGGGAPTGGTQAGGALTPAEQQELAELRKRFGR